MESRAKQAIKQLAQEKGVPEKQIVMEIEAAIAEGLRLSKENGNAAALEVWNQIPKKGEVPTAEEFILYVCNTMKFYGI